jgi:UDP-N-acetylglucosamine 2-epimerase
VRVICVAGARPNYMVAGARPNYMKVKPVMDALEERGAKVILVHTGQHYDPAMSDVFFAELGMRRPDHFLGAGSGTHAVQTCRVMTAFEPLAAGLAPDMVVVARRRARRWPRRRLRHAGRPCGTARPAGG